MSDSEKLRTAVKWLVTRKKIEGAIPLSTDIYEDFPWRDRIKFDDVAEIWRNLQPL